MKKFIEYIVNIYNLTKLKVAPATFALIHEEYQALNVLKRNGANVFAPEEVRCFLLILIARVIEWKYSNSSRKLFWKT